MKKEITKITIATMCIAIAICFAMVIHLIGGMQLGNIISPMHIPVFIGGMILGWKYGLVIGILTPLISSLTRGVPPIMPTGLGMSLELGTYGLVAGLFSSNIKLTKNQFVNLYLALIIGMIAGRLVYGIYYSTYYAIENNPYSLKVYATAVLIKPIIGIIIQLCIIPWVVYGIKRSNVLEKLA